jgi:hypothetical protein
VTKKSKKDGNGEWYRLLAVFSSLTKDSSTESSSDTVKGWRHKLQKAFLSKERPIRVEVRVIVITHFFRKV